MSTARKIVKRGFTLIEAVTTVGIMAVMAAVVIPQVVRQFDSAEPTRVQTDLKSIQTAIEAFHVNLRSQFPGDLDDLTNPLTAGAIPGAVDSAISALGAAAYTPAEATLWAGPYVDFSLIENAAGATRPTGFGGLVMDNFVCYNATTNTAGHTTAATNPACPAPGPTDRLFLAVRISGFSTTAFTTINSRFDGTTEVLPDAEGRIRSLGAPAILYFLALPLN